MKKYGMYAIRLWVLYRPELVLSYLNRCLPCKSDCGVIISSVWCFICLYLYEKERNVRRPDSGLLTWKRFLIFVQMHPLLTYNFCKSTLPIKRGLPAAPIFYLHSYITLVRNTADQGVCVLDGPTWVWLWPTIQTTETLRAVATT